MGSKTRGWLARALALLTILCLLPYLGWRLTTLGSGTTLLVSVPLLLLEGWGWTTFITFVAASWARPDPDPEPLDLAHRPLVGVLVDARDTSPEHLERTLVGLKMLRGRSDITILTDEDTPEIDAVVDRLGPARILQSTAPALGHVAASEQPAILWLDAGQITAPDLLEQVVPRLGSGVATCQVAVGWLDANSMAQLGSGRDQRQVMQQVVGPSLSRSGTALWEGPGSIVRPAALRPVVTDDETNPSQVRSNLLRSGWKTAHEPRQLIRGVAPTTLADHLAQRRRRTSEEWHAAFAPGGALRLGRPDLTRRLGPLQRLLMAATGLRLLLLAILTTVVITSGAVPFGTGVSTVALPWCVLATAAVISRRLLAGDSMMIGDWTRHAWRNLPADLPVPLPGTPTSTGEMSRVDRLAARFGPLWPVSLTMLILDIGLLVRGWDLIRPAVLPSFSTADRILMVAWTLGLLVPVVDAIATSAVRKERRRAPRLQASLPIALNGSPSRCVDISPDGMGVVADERPELGDRLMFWLSLPAHRGGQTHITGAARVRHIEIEPSGQARVGLEFDPLTDTARASLIAYCGVGHALEYADLDPIIITPTELPAAAAPARRPMGVLTVAAACVGVALMLLGPSAEQAVAEEIPRLNQVCVVTDDGAPLVGAEISWLTAEADEPLGTTEADGCLAVAQPATSTAYTATFAAGAATSDITAAQDGRLTLTIRGPSVSVFDADGAPLTFEARLFAAGWQELGEVEGTTTLPLNTNAEAIELTWNDLRFVTEIEPQITIVLARLTVEPGHTISEVDRGRGWEPFVDGMQALPGRVSARLADGTVVKLDVVGGERLALPSGTSTPFGWIGASTTSTSTTSTTTSTTTTTAPSTTVPTTTGAPGSTSSTSTSTTPPSSTSTSSTTTSSSSTTTVGPDTTSTTTEAPATTTTEVPTSTTGAPTTTTTEPPITTEPTSTTTAPTTTAPVTTTTTAVGS